jgi:hypothetical protein
VKVNWWWETQKKKWEEEKGLYQDYISSSRSIVLTLQETHGPLKLRCANALGKVFTWEYRTTTEVMSKTCERIAKGLQAISHSMDDEHILGYYGVIFE